MSEPAGQQPDPAYCLTEEDRDGTPYICTQNAGHHPRPHKMVKRANMTDKLRDALAAQTVARLEDTDLVRVDTQTEADATLAKRLHRTARLTERKRHTALLDYEVGAGDDITEAVLALDESRWAENLLADTPSLLRIKARVDAWVLQRGLTEDGGS